MRRIWLVLALALAACDPDPVGRRCDLGEPARPGETVFASGSLDCTSRLCLHVGGPEATGPESLIGRCTAACESDADCVGDSATACTSGFTCTPATSVGPFACEPVCVCRDDLEALTVACPDAE